jgi:hypothetical protein
MGIRMRDRFFYYFVLKSFWFGFVLLHTSVLEIGVKGKIPSLFCLGFWFFYLFERDAFHSVLCKAQQFRHDFHSIYFWFWKEGKRKWNFFLIDSPAWSLNCLALSSNILNSGQLPHFLCFHDTSASWAGLCLSRKRPKSCHLLLSCWVAPSHSVIT